MDYWKCAKVQKLSEIPVEVISSIKKEYESGEMSRRFLSLKYKVTRSNIDFILLQNGNKDELNVVHKIGKRKMRHYRRTSTVMTDELKLRIIRLYSTWKYSKKHLAHLLGIKNCAVASVWLNRWKIMTKSGYKTMAQLLADGKDDPLYVDDNDRKLPPVLETESESIPVADVDDDKQEQAELASDMNMQMSTLLSDQLWLWLQILKERHTIDEKTDVWAQARLVAQAIGATFVLEKEREKDWLEKFGNFRRYKSDPELGGKTGLLAEYTAENIYNIQEIGIQYQHQGNDRGDDSPDSLMVILCANAAGDRERAVICGHQTLSSLRDVPTNIMYFCRSSYPDPEELTKIFIRKLNERMSNEHRHILLFLRGSRDRVVTSPEQFSNVNLLFFPLDKRKCFINQPFDVGLVTKFQLGYTRCLLRMFQQQLQWGNKPETLWDFLKLNVNVENAIWWIAEAWQSITDHEINRAFLKILSVDAAQLTSQEIVNLTDDLQEIRKSMDEFPVECCLRSVPEDSVPCFFDVHREELEKFSSEISAQSVPDAVETENLSSEITQSVSKQDFPCTLALEKGEGIRTWAHFLETLQELKKFTSDKGELSLCSKLDDLETEIAYIMCKDVEKQHGSLMSAESEISVNEHEHELLRELLA